MNSKISGNMAKASLTFRLTRLSVERCPLIGGRFGEWERASWDRKKAAKSRLLSTLVLTPKHF